MPTKYREFAISFHAEVKKANMIWNTLTFNFHCFLLMKEIKKITSKIKMPINGYCILSYILRTINAQQKYQKCFANQIKFIF